MHPTLPHGYVSPSRTGAGVPPTPTQVSGATLTSKEVVNWEVQKSNGARMLTNIKGIPAAPLMQ